VTIDKPSKTLTSLLALPVSAQSTVHSTKLNSSKYVNHTM